MKRNHTFAAGALGIATILISAQKSMAAALITIDGTDELNIEHGTPAPGHSPTVQFAFTFGPVTAQNSADAGAPFPGPNTDFIYTGGNTAPGTQPNGGIGFGINNVQASALDFYELNVTVHPDNTQAFVTGDIKETDGDEFQYAIPLPAPGTSGDVFVPLSAVGFNNGAAVGDNIPDDSPITQIQLQYPFSGTSTSSGVLDITVHSIHITDTNVVPEPASLSLLALGGSLVGARRRRR